MLAFVKTRLPHHAFGKDIIAAKRITQSQKQELSTHAVASADKGTHGFSQGKPTSGTVILVGGRQPASACQKTFLTR